MWSVVHTGPAVWRQCGRVGSFPRWWRTKCQLWSSRRTSWRSTCLERRSSTAATATRLCPANLLCKFTHFSNDSSSMNMQIINDDASVVERRYQLPSIRIVSYLRRTSYLWNRRHCNKFHRLPLPKYLLISKILYSFTVRSMQLLALFTASIAMNIFISPNRQHTTVDNTESNLVACKSTTTHTQDNKKSKTNLCHFVVVEI